MFFSISLFALSFLQLASTSPINGRDSTPCVPTQGWTAEWMADAQSRGVVFCGESPGGNAQGSATSASIDSTPTVPSASNTSGQGSGTGTISGGNLNGSGGGDVAGTSSTTGPGTNATPGNGGPATIPGAGPVRKKKPCRKTKSANPVGSGPAAGAGAGDSLLSDHTSDNGTTATLEGTMNPAQGGGGDGTSSDSSSSSAVASSSASTPTAQPGKIADLPLGPGSAPFLTLQPSGDNSSAPDIPAQGTPNPSATDSSASSTPTPVNGKTFQATITRYTDDCAQRVGACGFLGSATSFQSAMSEHWTSASMPGQCGTCWKIFNGTMAHEDGTMATEKTKDIVVMNTNTCAYYSGDPTGSCSQTKEKPNDRWGSVVGVDLCKDTGASAAFWGERDAGIAVATIQQVDCGTDWEGELAPKSFEDWTKYEPAGTKSLSVKPGH